MELLRVAGKDGFEVLLTLDRGFAHQQNLEGLNISVVILCAKSSRLNDLAPLIQACQEVLRSTPPGSFRKVEY